MYEIIDDTRKVLDQLTDRWKSTKEIKESIKTNFDILGLLSQLNSLGFVEKIVKDEASPITSARWRITKAGKTFQRVLLSETPISKEKISNGKNQKSIVMSIPPQYQETFLGDHPEISLTADALKNILSQAKSTIRIFCPYIDASITSLLENVNDDVSIKIVTTIINKQKRNQYLERIRSSKKLFVRYMKKEESGIQIYQIHAKLVLIDDKFALVGSSNMTETSIYYNLELGVLLSDKYFVETLIEIFDDIYENYTIVA